MNIFDIKYDKLYLLTENEFIKRRVYLIKSKFDEKRDHYFIKIYKVGNGDFKCLGYLYFYLDILQKESRFIGIYIDNEYRNEGLAQVLISHWVSLCLDNGIYNLKTIQKQRKPFILYLLKKFKFDLLDITKYDTNLNTISICKSDINDTKYLLFKNPKQAQTFMQGSIKQGDNYHILDTISDDIKILDRVLLSQTYYSKDDNNAYTKSLKLIDNFKIK